MLGRGVAIRCAGGAAGGDRTGGRGGRCRYRLVRGIPVEAMISAMVCPVSRSWPAHASLAGSTTTGRLTRRPCWEGRRQAQHRREAGPGRPWPVQGVRRVRGLRQQRLAGAVNPEANVGPPGVEHANASRGDDGKAALSAKQSRQASVRLPPVQLPPRGKKRLWRRRDTGGRRTGCTTPPAAPLHTTTPAPAPHTPRAPHPRSGPPEPTPGVVRLQPHRTVLVAVFSYRQDRPTAEAEPRLGPVQLLTLTACTPKALRRR